ncbi:MAG: hypothetical protein GJT30_17625 [Geobacter sp.]|nr:hypothetical protein [Geobacter sp.]MSM41442.1 hypothetical protein [Geobacter sp.]
MHLADQAARLADLQSCLRLSTPNTAGRRSRGVTHSPSRRYAVTSPSITNSSRRDSIATEYVSSLQRTSTTIAISSPWE